LRPRSLDQVIGQTHLLGPGRPLRLTFESGKPHSMILWGPPGVGKTTLARLMASHFEADFIQISAVLSGVKEIREAVERARVNRAASRQTILFVDEVHRFNKAQQDAFLPHVESGLLTFIGATTENPSFEVVGALLSRAQVYVLKPLDESDLAALLEARAAGSGKRDQTERRSRQAAVGLCRWRWPPPAQPARTTVHRRAGRQAQAIDAAFIGEALARRAAFRQRRRCVLRPDIRPAQIRARLQPGCRALLALPHAGWRRRSACIWAAASSAWRWKTSAWPIRAP
jgi:adenylate kinase family enzyme